ncbi:MAG: hypothetical protein E3J90_03030 [Promethearchaeota archaeon]|nr:MAG: hypothetical protein E3J90_03030 [Candidatus Lokiarchaeota archaeon]
MVEIRNYVWLAPFVAGLLGIMSIFFPAGTADFAGYIKMDFWMWGMWVQTGYIGANTIFLTDIFSMVGIGCSVLTLIFSIIIFITANQIRKNSKTIIDTRMLWIASGILIIIINITWAVIITFMNYGVILHELWSEFYPPAFQYNAMIWFYFNFNFGIIGPLFSGILAIIAGKYSKRFKR